MSTEHEARARRAKAVALATVLADTSAIEDPRCVRDLTVPGWELAARAATERNLLGQGRTVHIPNSPETVAAVERELRIMQVERRVDVEQPRTDAGRPGQPSCERHGPMVERPASAQTREQAACGTWWDCDDPGCRGSFLVPTGRRAADSQGYREHMRHINPVPNRPEPTDDELFAAFAQADRR